MTIAREFVSRLERLAERVALPRVRALHLPPASADGTREGEFCALELEDGTLGLSYVLLGDTLERLRAGAGGGGVAGAAALDVARWYADRDGGDRTVGFAAVNALTAFLFERAGFAPGAATDTIGHLDPGPGDHVGMIGLFPPLVDRVVRTGARLTVLELKARLAGEREGWRVTLDPEALRECGKVLCTSTVLLNDTVDAVVARCAGARAFAVLGPGASCLPDPLFARGVTLAGGTWIVDRPGLRDAIVAGAPWGETARKTAIRPADYPGFEALLGRLAG
ncbi:MAG TPA: DUF364 domain-containing protein [Anaeromyxobacter sp.]|nr:DUF364 domain-containing protein [Anaeromyxobacter sp.]